MGEKISPNFTREEMACNCGCGEDEMQPEFVQRLQATRTILGEPMTMTSARRCLTYNASPAVGGVDSSAHVDGWAGDVSAVTSTYRKALIAAALRAGFNRIGVAKTFVHLDCDPSKAPNVMWIY